MTQLIPQFGISIEVSFSHVVIFFLHTNTLGKFQEIVGMRIFSHSSF